MNPTPTMASPNRPLLRPACTAITLVAAAVLAACSSAPPPNVALDQARSRYEAAQRQPGVASMAPQELLRAGEALRVAEQARVAGEPLATVDHLAYVAGQRVAIAQDTATTRAAQAVTTGAAAEPDRMRLADRTAEADKAKTQLSASRQDNAAQSAQLAQAATSAQDDQSRLARRDAQVGDLQAQLREINGRKTERGIVVTLGDLLFATGQSQLQGEGAGTMAKLAEFLKRNPQRTAAIEGYTDSVGSEASNQALSDRRAHTVMDALVGLGVPTARLSSSGFGESRPVADNATADGRRANRRVEVVFASDAGDVMLK